MVYQKVSNVSVPSALVEKRKVLCSNICSKLCVNHKSINLIFYQESIQNTATSVNDCFLGTDIN